MMLRFAYHRPAAGLCHRAAQALLNSNQFSRTNRVRPCAGGKWTTYRLMAQDAIDRAMKTGKLGVQARPCATTHLKLVCALIAHRVRLQLYLHGGLVPPQFVRYHE